MLASRDKTREAMRVKMAEKRRRAAEEAERHRLAAEAHAKERAETLAREGIVVRTYGPHQDRRRR